MRPAGGWGESTRVAGVGVGLEIIATFGELESRLGDDLIEGIRPSTDDFARVAVATIP